MMASTKTLAVAAIEKGTVIDHIPAGNALKILQFLQLIDAGKQLTLGVNLLSNSMKRKDLIKIEEGILTQAQLDIIAIFASEATINQIENFEVIHKSKIVIPQDVIGVIACPNKLCISNHEPMASRFVVDSRRQGIQLCCRYCRKIYLPNDLG